MNTEHILIIEDDEIVMRVLKTQLEGQGYRVTCAPTIPAAMQATQSQMPDLMVLDLTVLDGDPFAGLSDGFAFLALLRINHHEANFPIIVYSVENSPHVLARAKELGVTAVLAKTQPVSEVLSAVRKALDERRISAAA